MTDHILTAFDLFSGTGSSTTGFEEDGWNVVKIEKEERFPADLHIDILDLEAEDLAYAYPAPDFIWASPPCTTFSVASLYHHWLTTATCKTCAAPLKRASYGKWAHLGVEPCARPMATNKRHYPKTDAAELGLALLRHTISIIEALDPPFFIIENPRAMMKRMPEVAHLELRTITHCQYGDPRRMKPTDLFGRFPPGFTARSCKNGDPCHVSAPRGATTGTQGLNKTDAGMLPPDLSRELAAAARQALESTSASSSSRTTSAST